LVWRTPNPLPFSLGQRPQTLTPAPLWFGGGINPPPKQSKKRSFFLWFGARQTLYPLVWGKGPKPLLPHPFGLGGG